MRKDWKFARKKKRVKTHVWIHYDMNIFFSVCFHIFICFYNFVDVEFFLFLFLFSIEYRNLVRDISLTHPHSYVTFDLIIFSSNDKLDEEKKWCKFNLIFLLMIFVCSNHIHHFGQKRVKWKNMVRYFRCIQYRVNIIKISNNGNIKSIKRYVKCVCVCVLFCWNEFLIDFSFEIRLLNMHSQQVYIVLKKSGQKKKHVVHCMRSSREATCSHVHWNCFFFFGH